MRVFYTTSRVYVVDNTAAYLRNPDADPAYASYTEYDPPDDRNWNDIDEVVRHDDGGTGRSWTASRSRSPTRRPDRRDSRS